MLYQKPVHVDLQVLGCDVSGVEVSLGSVEDSKRPLHISTKDSLWTSEALELPFTVSVSSPLTKNTIEVSHLYFLLYLAKMHT